MMVETRMGGADGMEAAYQKDECENGPRANNKWTLLLYIAGVLYIFVALAIVCDEFFVPALEEVSSERHLNLSMDVAGATIMAAGGSAPELFTALFGTFQESEVAVGTIVGSAVFNILFVIGACSFFSKELLHLNWWPLLRDSTYYVVGLIAFAYFIAVNSKGEVELWEALFLFILYVGYVILMRYNSELHQFVTGRNIGDGELNTVGDEYVLYGKANSQSDSIDHLTFHAGLLKVISDFNSWKRSAVVGLVVKLQDEIHAAFKRADQNNDGRVNQQEFQKILKYLHCDMSIDEITQTFSEIDEKGSGTIGAHEIIGWYVKSETRLLASLKAIFDEFDHDNAGYIGSRELKKILQKLSPKTTDTDVHEAMASARKGEQGHKISFEEFSQLLIRSSILRKDKEGENDSKGVFSSLDPPKGKGFLQWLEYISLLPVIATLAFTIPDVRRPGIGRWCYVSFSLSIVWIGVYSYYMVDFAEIVGNSIGVPPMVMGLTFIAAGTSVPDLLSSVFVARRGEGDMAVSSTIGSNIFDILVGLSVPWIAYTGLPGKPKSVAIDSDGVGISIVILIAIIIITIVIVHCNRWKLTKISGIMMFVFYIGFLIQAIFREMPFDLC